MWQFQKRFSSKRCGTSPDEPTCGCKMPCTLEIISFPLMLEFSICCLLFIFFCKSEVITDVYTHRWSSKHLRWPIEHLKQFKTCFFWPWRTFANTDLENSWFCRICSIRNNNFAACTCFQVVNFNKRKKGKWMMFGKLSRTSGNKRECGLCQCFSCFYQTVFVVLVCFQVLFVSFFSFFFILTMAVLEPFSQIKKK